MPYPCCSETQLLGDSIQRPTEPRAKDSSGIGLQVDKMLWQPKTVRLFGGIHFYFFGFWGLHDITVKPKKYILVAQGVVNNLVKKHKRRPSL